MLALPKSISFMIPNSLTTTLSSLRSRWARPMPWINVTPLRICKNEHETSSRDILPVMTMAKRSYGAYSITSYHFPFSWMISSVSMILPWCSVEPIQNSAVTFFVYSLSVSYAWRARNSLTANVVPSELRFINRTDPPAPAPSTLPNLPYLEVRPWSSPKGNCCSDLWLVGVLVPDFSDDELGDAFLFDFFCPPIFKNRFNSDIEPREGSVSSLLSRAMIGSFFDEKLFLSERRSAELRHGRGRAVVEEDGEVRCLLFRPLNTNRGSMVSRFLDCGGRLLDA